MGNRLRYLGYRRESSFSNHHPRQSATSRASSTYCGSGSRRSPPRKRRINETERQQFQPWPNRKYVAEWAFLYDVRGGLLAQPLIKWNPGNSFSVDLFYNFVDGKLHGDGTDTLTRAIDFADEICLRVTYEL